LTADRYETWAACCDSNLFGEHFGGDTKMFLMASRLPGPSEITLTAKDILTIADDQLSKLGASRIRKAGLFSVGPSSLEGQ
jgi:hypothetical protein